MEMTYRRLGKSGLQVSALSFGAWVTFGRQIDAGAAAALMQRAYDSGINFFDNAEAYANGDAERVMGAILQRMAWPRDTWLVSSKVFWGGTRPNQEGLSRKRVIEACHAALRRLQVDYLDLYFCHRPDPFTPVEETVRAMDVLVQQGKVLYWGTSQWSAVQVMEAHAIARQYGLTPPTMEQPQYNLFARHKVETEFKRLYTELGLGTTTWSPLAGGLLTGKYRGGEVPEGSRLALPAMSWLRDSAFGRSWKVRAPAIQRLVGIADELGCSLAQLAIAWCLKNQNISSVILGATRVEQLQENLGALALAPQLTGALLDRIDEATAGTADLPEH